MPTTASSSPTTEISTPENRELSPLEDLKRANPKLLFNELGQYDYKVKTPAESVFMNALVLPNDNPCAQPCAPYGAYDPCGQPCAPY